MKLLDFNTNKGFYKFELKGIDTKAHEHPLVEVILAIDGTFSLETELGEINHLVFAVIEAHQKHKLVSENAKMQLLMLESNNELLASFLSETIIGTEKGVFFSREMASSIPHFKKIECFAKNNDLKYLAENRIRQCVAIMEKKILPYEQLMKSLTNEIFLSESRLSHLFKAHMGISVKKYLLWCRLKKAIDMVVHEKKNLTEASLLAGFYDQAHLSNAFKSLLGVSPSSAYNSRIIQ